MVQGTHFTVLKQIHPSDVADLHISCIDYVGRRLAPVFKALHATGTGVKAKAAKERASTKVSQSLLFFRGLFQLVGPLTGRDAVRARAHAEEALQSAGGKIGSDGSAKSWEPYRAYEKRLLTIASKDPEVRVVPRKKAVPDAEDTEADDDVAGGEGEDDEPVDTPTKSKSMSGSRASLNPKKRTASQVQEEDSGLDLIAGPESLGDPEIDIDLAFPDESVNAGSLEADGLDMDVDV